MWSTADSCVEREVVVPRVSRDAEMFGCGCQARVCPGTYMITVEGAICQCTTVYLGCKSILVTK